MQLGLGLRLRPCRRADSGQALTHLAMSAPGMVSRLPAGAKTDVCAVEPADPVVRQFDVNVVLGHSDLLSTSWGFNDPCNVQVWSCVSGDPIRRPDTKRRGRREGSTPASNDPNCNRLSLHARKRRELMGLGPAGDSLRRGKSRRVCGEKRLHGRC